MDPGNIYVSFDDMTVTLRSGETIPILALYNDVGEPMTQDEVRTHEGIIGITAGPMASGKMFDMDIRYVCPTN